LKRDKREVEHQARAHRQVRLQGKEDHYPGDCPAASSSASRSRSLAMNPDIMLSMK